VYLLKRYSPSDSFCAFFLRVYLTQKYLIQFREKVTIIHNFMIILKI